MIKKENEGQKKNERSKKNKSREENIINRKRQTDNIYEQVNTMDIFVLKVVSQSLFPSSESFYYLSRLFITLFTIEVKMKEQIKMIFRS